MYLITVGNGRQGVNKKGRGGTKGRPPRYSNHLTGQPGAHVGESPMVISQSSQVSIVLGLQIITLKVYAYCFPIAFLNAFKMCLP